MAGFKETPRQKMIGMMYLVLTALLALNVSKEILDAFIIVNDSVEKTSENFSAKIAALHEDFSMQYQMNQDKVGPFYTKSEEAKNYSQDLINYIDSVKFVVIARVERIPFDTARIMKLADIKAKDNYNDPTSYLVGGEGMKNGEGYAMMNKINEYKVRMLELIPEEEREMLNIGLETGGNYRSTSKQSLDWVQYNFYHTILAADVTIFNKIVNEIRNAEYDVVSHLYQGIDKEDFKFSDIKAKVLPQSRYIFKGETFDAEVFLAAVDENSEPEMYYQMGAVDWDDSFINSATHLTGDSGFVRLSINTSNLETREYTFAGQIGVKSPTGQIDFKPFKSSFIVAEPSANVAATKMNVFYRGVDNPIRLSAAGVPASQLKYDIFGDGLIANTADGLIVKNLKKRTVQSVTIKVYSEIGNQRKELGEQVFRVKDLPPPNINVRNMDKGVVARQSLLANPYLLCELPEYVNFEYKYQVTRFTLSIVKNGDNFDKQASSPYLTEDMKSYIQTARKNTMLVFSNIEVQGPIEKMSVPNFAVKLN
ncbi:gliding motility protein GldM [Lentimicrobium sp. S6]|uniref:type IX secretion system motor protein PorM/GldM n=1 Tax=Lentimicrobium sp. S6 TaxID=2735872 RepID=UPI001556FBA3|nr:gliding motility protein GldM [Lentimicrobium sp. S6]NPD44444.1 gliding motility protein GldM [Lentimicrobium sp. S6]